MTVQLAIWLMKIGSNILVFLSLATLTACAADTADPVATRPVSATIAEPVAELEPAELMIAGMPARLIEEPVRVAIMLPLTGDQRGLGAALLNAASMALFDAYDPRITLLPFDTGASGEGAALAAADVIAADVDVVLGPLFSDSIKAAGPLLKDAGITMIGFSSDRRVATPGQFIMGFAPEDEVRRVVSYAVRQGHSKFAALIPDGLYGERVSTALGSILEQTGSRMMAMESYPPSAAAVFEPVKRLANYDARKRARDAELRAMEAVESDVGLDIIEELEKKEVLGEVNFSAVLVPEGGQLLRTIAPLLPYYEVDPAKVKFLGTGLWNDASLLKEPPLRGAWFAAPEPEKPAAFMEKYEDIYGERPPRIATLAYDAMALVAWRIRHPVSEERFAFDALLDNKGFHGIDGLFRFKPDGTVERALAIIELDTSGFKVIEKAPQKFPRFHNYIIGPAEK